MKLIKIKKNPKIIWFTGLSGVGKTTISNNLFRLLKKKKYKVLKLDGDQFRKKLKNTKNFSKQSIEKNNMMIINFIKKKQFEYEFFLVSVISPLLKTRMKARKTFKKNYYEIQVFCKIKTLVARDTKGLYKKAIEKKLNNLIGFNSKIKYQKSNYKVIKIDTDKLSVNKSTKIVLNSILNGKKKI